MSCSFLPAVAVAANMLDEASPVAEGVPFFEYFNSSQLVDWHKANYDFDHQHFATDWRAEHVQTTELGLHLELLPHDKGRNLFAGGSVRRNNRSHFGRYSALMKPATGSGIVTGFFVYTGEYYGTQHDEIDIEFLGKDTTRIHIATFVDGVRNSRFINLGFDASGAVRQYGFDWLPDRITWWVDGCKLYEVTESDQPIPQTPSFLFANLWAVKPSLDAWAGTPVDDAKAAALFKHVQFTPLPR